MLFVLCGMAQAFEPVTEEVSGGHIDWSEMRLEVTVTSQHTTGAWQDRRLQEQDAHDRLTSLIDDIASDIALTPTTTASALMSKGDALADRLSDGLRRWGVEEARYHTGGVALDAVLDLRTWLAPALIEQALTADLPIEGGATGLLIDARGHRVPLTLSPELTTTTGRRLVHVSALSEDTARMRTPVIYVRDPADPRATARAGDAPLFATIGEVREGVMILDDASAGRLMAQSQLAALVAAGRVVVVVDQ
ncbi:MAG: hypothetical protein ACI8RZ_006037 [Myxococcota bacterium]|jgi:hypothetical protein